MFIPIGDTQVKGGVKPLISYILIAINVAVFLYQFTLPLPACKEFVYTFGNIPAEVSRLEDLHTLLTSMFLHGGWMHLLGNMLFLWVFADNIESVVGRSEFIVFYITGGITAAMIHFLFNMGSNIPAVGASGAIAAVMGAYLVLFPKSKIKVMFVLFFWTIYMPALVFLGLWFGQQLLSGIGNLGLRTADSPGVAWWAHIGGFIFGLVYGYIKRDRLYIEYSFKP